MTIPRWRLRLWASSLLLLTLLAAPAPVSAAPELRLPDLAMAGLHDFVVQTTSSGRRLLRFTTVMVNIGDGPFEVRARRTSTREATMTTKQRIFDADGISHWSDTPAVLRYSGDGHDHWHIQHIERSYLYGLSAPLPKARRAAKTGFCFFDTNTYRLSLPRAPRSRVYQEWSCGYRSSLRAWMGLSVGWSDKYPWNFAYQYIDITGLSAGDYRICSYVDRFGHFRETKEENNKTWADVRIRAGSSRVELLQRGWYAPCEPAPATP